jgi:acetyl esterase/lipase
MALLWSVLLWTTAAAPPVEPTPPAARVEADVAYADGGDKQKLDLYLPAKKDFTTVVFIYGGGWHSGSRKSVAPIGKKLQSLGYGCVCISHRLSPPDKFPAQVEDAAAAAAWVKKHIAARGGDPRRVFLMGHSSGAHLALLLAADPKYLARHKLTPADFAGVVGLSTPVDLEPRGTGKGYGDVLLAGRGADVFGRDRAVMKEASPIQHISRDLPPVLLVVGDRDFPMLEGDAKEFVAKAKDAGVKVKLHVARERTHMGVVQHLLDEGDPILEQVLAFLRDGGRAKL